MTKTCDYYKFEPGFYEDHTNNFYVEVESIFNDEQVITTTHTHHFIKCMYDDMNDIFIDFIVINDIRFLATDGIFHTVGLRSLDDNDYYYKKSLYYHIKDYFEENLKITVKNGVVYINTPCFPKQFSIDHTENTYMEDQEKNASLDFSNKIEGYNDKK